MNIKYYQFIPVLILPAVLMLQACSPKPVFRMSPVADHTSWLSGREYVSSELDSILVVLAYYRHMAGLIYLDIEVVNLGSEPLHVDPDRFSYNAYDDNPGMEETSSVHRPALNPEEELLELDLVASKVSADRRTSSGFGAAFIALGLVSDVAAMANGASSEEMGWRVSDRVDMAIEKEIRDERFRRSLNDLAEARNIWEFDMLRKTDLQPDEYVRGLVAFPNRESALFYDFIFEMGGNEHRFRYEQYRFKP